MTMIQLEYSWKMAYGLSRHHPDDWSEQFIPLDREYYKIKKYPFGQKRPITQVRYIQSEKGIRTNQWPFSKFDFQPAGSSFQLTAYHSSLAVDWLCRIMFSVLWMNFVVAWSKQLWFDEAKVMPTYENNK